MPKQLRAIRARWWEAMWAIPLALLVVLFLVGGETVAGAVLLAVLTLAFLWRVEIVERNVAGGYARVRGWVLIGQWFAMGAIYVVLVGVLWVASRDNWTDTSPGRVAVYASAGLAFLLAREMIRRGDDAFDFLSGGEAEVRVARELDQLRAHGWDVVHDIKKDGGGNVDHLVLARHIAFTIETKSGRGTARGRGQALANAAWAKRKYQRGWVHAVLCVLSEPPPVPRKVGKAWVTGIADLCPLLERLAGVRRS